MKDCVFCRIGSGEIEADIVDEGASWVAFRDANPQAPTHLLVIPREHVPDVDALGSEGAELAAKLLSACAEVARGEDLSGGYRVVTNVGDDGGQSVAHLHFHVLGGRRLGWPPG